MKLLSFSLAEIHAIRSNVYMNEKFSSEMLDNDKDYSKFHNNTNVIKLKKINSYLKNLNDEQKTKFWIKTLFASYSILPEIINTVDKIIELQASSMSFVSDIYNVEKSAFSQVEKVIDLTERKNNLVNIYLMVKELYKTLDIQSIEIVEKKYLLGYSAEDLARELGVSARTIYRRVERIIDEVYLICKRRNWKLAFIESQIKEEGWLQERFKKMVTEYFKNINYNESYNISSSRL